MLGCRCLMLIFVFLFYPDRYAVLFQFSLWNRVFAVSCVLMHEHTKSLYARNQKKEASKHIRFILCIHLLVPFCQTVDPFNHHTLYIILFDVTQVVEASLCEMKTIRRENRKVWLAACSLFIRTNQCDYSKNVFESAINENDPPLSCGSLCATHCVCLFSFRKPFIQYNIAFCCYSLSISYISHEKMDQIKKKIHFFFFYVSAYKANVYFVV